MRDKHTPELSRLKNLPPWARRKYFLLKLEFGAKQFTIKDLENFFQEKFKQTGNEEFLIKNIGELVAVLSNAELIKEVGSDPHDSRRKIYQLVFPEFEAKDLNEILLIISDHLRASLSVQDSEQLFLAMIFYKTMSDRWHAFVDKHKSDFNRINEREIYLSANDQVLRLYDPENNELLTWKSVVTSDQNLLNEKLAQVFKRIAKLNSDKGLSGLKYVVDIVKRLNSWELSQIIEILDLYDLSFYPPDEIGKFYRELLDTVSKASTKYRGEFLTVRTLRNLIPRLLNVKNDSVILDPAAGTGSLLIETALNSESPETLRLLGLDINEWAVTMAAMNALISGISNYAFRVGDSLLGTPVEELLKEFDTTRADYVVLDPPWSAVVSREVAAVGKNLPYLIDRDNLPSWRSADWLWVQLAAFYCKRKSVVILHPGALSRLGADKEIRKTLLSMDIIEAIIQLPSKLIPWTGISPVVLVINKEKPETLKRKVLMINVTEGVDETGRGLIQLKQESIDRIVSTYKSHEEVEGFSRIVPLEELAENDYNLTPQFYVFKRESIKINTKEVISTLKELLQKEEELSRDVLALVEKILEAETK
ncbi:MAG: hypothetical protein DRN92_00570 [Thermoproteota archaeon]|nr:MAG: hypothetical protein DRN92_00570 [Candidatus Korarchaeota archaeon]